MRKKNLLILLASISLILVFAAVPYLTACTPAAPEVFTLKAVTSWPIEWNDTSGFREFFNRVNERGQGRLVIEYLGAGEVYPVEEQLEPLKLGTIDMVFGAGSYYIDTFPEPIAVAFNFGATPADFRASGLYKKLDEIGRKEHGITFLGAAYSCYFNIWLTEPIKTMDELKSRKIRSLAMYDPILHGFGIPTTFIPWAETYSAVERGVVDGIAYPDLGIIDLGLQDILKYVIYPPILRSEDCPIYMNADSFDALPDDLQKLLVDTMIEVENDLRNIYGPLEQAEIEELQRHGLQAIQITDEEWQSSQQYHWEKGIPEVVMTVSPKYGEEIKQLLSRHYPPKDMLQAPYQLS